MKISGKYKDDDLRSKSVLKHGGENQGINQLYRSDGLTG